jgi:chorismate dehydratase
MTQQIAPRHGTEKALRVGSVSYLNAKPLIYGLDDGVDLHLAVPSALLEQMRRGDLDVALLPVIDYQRMPGLRIVPAGGIGCDGSTLTVRVFSRVPIEQIRTLACDTESHTSVALAQIVLAHELTHRPRFVDLPREHSSRADVEAMLLIGDKVICEEPAGYDYQLDLGDAWKRITGLPFVFAVWMARDGVELGELPARLEQARRDGMAHISQIIGRHAVPRGWPAGIALQYLTVYLQYQIGPRQLEAIRLFHKIAADAGIIGRCHELVLA